MTSKHWWLAGLLLCCGAAPVQVEAQPLQWEPLVAPPPPMPSLSPPGALRWTRVEQPIEPPAPKSALAWVVAPPDAVIAPPTEAEQVTPVQDATEAIQTAYRAFDANAPTFASSRALLRNERWHPQISYKVPNGYGPQGFIVDALITGTDCSLGKGPCEPFSTWSDWQQSLDTQANGSTYFNVGFGDTQTWGGVMVTTSAETISARLGQGDGPLVRRDRILEGVQTGLHYAKAIGPDTSFRTGVENLITWDSEDISFSDMTRNLYLVGSQRIRIRKATDPSRWLRNAYLTLGVGNGEFKPIERSFQDQTEALKEAGCSTYGYTASSPCSQERFKRALRTGSDYGSIHPIGSLAIEAVDGVHLIGEWDGRNLNAGISWRPFRDLGLVITPMVESIVRNCEYPGCAVTPIRGYPDRVPLPDAVLTDRVRLSLQASFSLKF